MLLVLLHLFACDDTVFPAHEEEITSEGVCVALDLFETQCLSCHSAASALGGLDLETDPVAFLEDPTFVTPGDGLESYLYRKLANDLESDEGGVMPPSGSPSDDILTGVQTWIDDGADTSEAADCP